jgi:hypothetical protein
MKITNRKRQILKIMLILSNGVHCQNIPIGLKNNNIIGNKQINSVHDINV